MSTSSTFRSSNEERLFELRFRIAAIRWLMKEHQIHMDFINSHPQKFPRPGNVFYEVETAKFVVATAVGEMMRYGNELKALLAACDATIILCSEYREGVRISNEISKYLIRRH
ncbi:hypothetical protein RF11_13976 [Thelohanellus kitauei]|uniref:Uncharacterized protein n=1 Tax=Thelohanellus kitauei TaxID=669202 RepID=A0A0C2IVX2_THEKT|nr:hypothetical protein RF11_13976 [Thelohanellus kitauei]